MNYDTIYKVIVSKDSIPSINKMSYDDIQWLITNGVHPIQSNNILLDLESAGISCLISEKVATFLVDISFVFSDAWAGKKNYEEIRKCLTTEIIKYLRNDKIEELIK